MSGLADGKLVIATGGEPGNGAGVSRDLVRNGARVCIADLDLPRAPQTAKDIGSAAIATAVNVADRPSRNAVIAAGVEVVGKLDVVSKCAEISQSILVGHRRKLEDIDGVPTLLASTALTCVTGRRFMADGAMVLR